MSSVTGQLVLDRDRSYLTELAGHLYRQKGVTVHIYDADGNLAMSSPGNGAAPQPDDGQAELLRRLCNECRETDTVRRLTSPDGRGIEAKPIRNSSSYFGTLVASGPDTDSLAARSTHVVLDAMLEVLAEESSKEHEIESLAGELALRYEEIELLYEIDEKIPLRSYTSNVIEFVAEKAFSVLECSCLASVGIDTEVAGMGEGCRLFWAPDRVEPPSTVLQIEAEQTARQLAARCVRTGKPEVIVNLNRHPELRTHSYEFGSAMAQLLIVESDSYGCLVAFKPVGEPFSSYHLKLMSAIARKSAFVIRDSRLYEDLDNLFFNLIRLLVNTIENKDRYTKGHSQRVKTFTVRLAELMGLPRAEIDTLNLAGLLHDIGKQGIPDAVLKKEGELTDEEMAMIKTHPVRGVNLIQHINQFRPCLPLIRHHHEQIDGRGYPDGLKGDEIPLGARIIAVADTYDALTSDRCYRSRFPTAGAFRVIEKAAGNQLDPQVVGLLLDNREEFARYSQGVNGVRSNVLQAQPAG